MESWRRGGDWPTWQTQEVTDIVDVKMSMAGELVKDEEPFCGQNMGVCLPLNSLCGASGVWSTHTHTHILIVWSLWCVGHTYTHRQHPPASLREITHPLAGLSA